MGTSYEGDDLDDQYVQIIRRWGYRNASLIPFVSFYSNSKRWKVLRNTLLTSGKVQSTGLTSCWLSNLVSANIILVRSLGEAASLVAELHQISVGIAAWMFICAVAQKQSLLPGSGSFLVYVAVSTSHV